MIRLAAVGDIHFGADLSGSLRPSFEQLPDLADALLIAGDLTLHGDPDEARYLADEINGVGIPVFAVLGNHDFHSGREDQVRETMESVDVTVLEGDSVEIAVGEERVGIAGTKGFGGGFFGACGTEFGEPEMKSFIAHSRSLASTLGEALSDLRTDFRIALTHCSPIEETCRASV